MTLTETRYEQRIEIQREPVVNLIPNPSAHNNLDGATSAGLASFVRQTSGGFGSPSGTAFRLNGSAAATDSYMSIGGDSGGGIRLGMRVGTQYTMSATGRIDAPLGGAAGSRSRRIVVFYRSGSGAFTEVISTPVANTASTQTRVSVTFTLPVGTTEAFIRLYHGHPSASSFWWHSLRLSEGTSTLYFDGGGYGDAATDFYHPTLSWSFADVETGWDGLNGNSTSRMVDRAENLVLADASMEIEYDRNRVPFVTATVTAPIPTNMNTPIATLPNTFARLDPRRSRPVILNFALAHYTRSGSGEFEVTSRSPIAWGDNVAGKLWVRDLDVDWINDRITLRCESGECVFEDKKRVASIPLDTGATNAQELFLYALRDVGETSMMNSINPAAADILIPDGDRQLWLQGESASSIFEQELAAVDLRHYADDIGFHYVLDFTQPPAFSGAPTTLTDGDAGTIISARESFGRTGEWRDATLVKSEYTDTNGDRQVSYQRFPDSGDNRKGEVTTINRPIPSAGYAEQVTKRATRRAGRIITLEAVCDFNHRVGRTIGVTISNRGGGTNFGITPERITYRPAEGTMTIEGYRN